MTTNNCVEWFYYKWLNTYFQSHLFRWFKRYIKWGDGCRTKLLLFASSTWRSCWFSHCNLNSMYPLLQFTWSNFIVQFYILYKFFLLSFFFQFFFFFKYRNDTACSVTVRDHSEHHNKRITNSIGRRRRRNDETTHDFTCHTLLHIHTRTHTHTSTHHTHSHIQTYNFLPHINIAQFAIHLLLDLS